ncbi:MAG: hypothetical protein ACRDHX_02565 [Chloroflexota bacterium]
MSESNASSAYEGFPSRERCDRAQVQRYYLYEWRLSVAGADTGLLLKDYPDKKLSLDRKRSLDEEVNSDPRIATWSSLEKRCGTQLAHFLGKAKGFREPTPQTLAWLARLGGERSLAELLKQRGLKDHECRQLTTSMDLQHAVRQLVPEWLPPSEPDPIDDPTEELGTPAPPAPSDGTVGMDVRRADALDWRMMLDEGTPESRFRAVAFDGEACLDGRGRWRDTCHDRQAIQTHVASPPYLNILAGTLTSVDPSALVDDLHVDGYEERAVRDFLHWRKSEVAIGTSETVLRRFGRPLLPEIGAMTVNEGYRLLATLLPFELRNGWSAPNGKDLRSAVLSRLPSRTPLMPPTWASRVDIWVAGVNPPRIYLHAWQPLRLEQLFFGRLVRDVWGGVLAYCQRAGGHWFFVRSGQRRCGTADHGPEDVVWVQTPNSEDRPQPTLHTFPLDLYDQLVAAAKDEHSWFARVHEVLSTVGVIDTSLIDPTLALYPEDIEHALARKQAPSMLAERFGSDREIAKQMARIGADLLRNTEEGEHSTAPTRSRPPRALEDVVEGVRAAVIGPTPKPRYWEQPWGLQDLLERPVSSDSRQPLSWPRFIRYGHTFPAVRLVDERWLDSQGSRPHCGPASLAQLVLEVAGADAVERSLVDTDVQLHWGPFWCARPGCSRLFVTKKLQRDERACVVDGGLRSLFLSQYCSHACFLADMS